MGGGIWTKKLELRRPRVGPSRAGKAGFKFDLGAESFLVTRRPPMARSAPSITRASIAADSW